MACFGAIILTRPNEVSILNLAKPDFYLESTHIYLRYDYTYRLYNVPILLSFSTSSTLKIIGGCVHQGVELAPDNL